MLKNNAIQSIEQTSAGVHFGNMVQFSGEAITRTEKDATALADVLRFLAGMMQLQRDRNPEVAKFAALLDSLEVKATGSTVSLSLAVPEADLENTMKPRTRIRRRAAGSRSAEASRAKLLLKAAEILFERRNTFLQLGKLGFKRRTRSIEPPLRSGSATGCGIASAPDNRCAYRGSFMPACRGSLAANGCSPSAIELTHASTSSISENRCIRPARSRSSPKVWGPRNISSQSRAISRRPRFRWSEIR